MSLELWAADPMTAHEGQQFDPQNPPKGLKYLEGIELLSDWKSNRVPQWIQWFQEVRKGHGYVWVAKDEIVSYLHSDSMAVWATNKNTASVVNWVHEPRPETAREKWEQLKSEARQYKYIEPRRIDVMLHNWPNSKYGGIWGNNSNTFIIAISKKALGESAYDYVTHLGLHTGRSEPQPISAKYEPIPVPRGTPHP